MTQPLRRTKIVATLGPAMDGADTMLRMIAAGVDVVRANFSHGDIETHRRRIENVRVCAEKLSKVVGILVDLQGPKIRIARFKSGSVNLVSGDTFVLDAALPEQAGTQARVGIDYPALPEEVSPGDTLLVDDGRIVLSVERVVDAAIECIVVEGGELSNNKGINLGGGGLTAGSITDKDKADIQRALALEVDYIALSFTRSAEDINQARRLLGVQGRYVGIIAKIERAEALASIDEIISAADGVMVARGDLGIEIGEAQVPGAQKLIISRARHANKPVITATQMMDSMIHNKIPTRAEVSDVANAVLDGTDAVMLSAETAVGAHPALVVQTVSRVCLAAEEHPSMWTSRHRVHAHFGRVDEAIAMATMYAANHMDIVAIVTLTESGTTPLWMSRIDSGIPIYALSRQSIARGRMALYRGVYPIAFDITKIKRESINAAAIAKLRALSVLGDTGLIILTKGDAIGVHGGSNTMKIVNIADE